MAFSLACSVDSEVESCKSLEFPQKIMNACVSTCEAVRRPVGVVSESVLRV
jgi:hypothetical protein